MANVSHALMVNQERKELQVRLEPQDRKDLAERMEPQDQMVKTAQPVMPVLQETVAKTVNQVPKVTTVKTVQKANQDQPAPRDHQVLQDHQAMLAQPEETANPELQVVQAKKDREAKTENLVQKVHQAPTENPEAQAKTLNIALVPNETLPKRTRKHKAAIDSNVGLFNVAIIILILDIFFQKFQINC